MNTVNSRISHLENNSEINNRNHDITISRIKKNKLKVLTERFVFVPADKAANNVVVV